jgi:hypothetical protein
LLGYVVIVGKYRLIELMNNCTLPHAGRNLLGATGEASKRVVFNRCLTSAGQGLVKFLGNEASGGFRLPVGAEIMEIGVPGEERPVCTRALFPGATNGAFPGCTPRIPARA